MRRYAAWAALFIVAALSVCRIVEHDTPWYLAAGKLIYKTRSLPTIDPFSYTSTRAWMNHEWLSELVLALVHRVGGFIAIGLLQGVIVAATLALCVRRIDRLLDAPIAWALCAFVLREAAAPRAQLFSTLLFAATLSLVLDDDEGAERRLWLCVPIQLLWTQLHGGNPTGVALVGLLFLSRPSLHRAAITACCALATIVGPYGIRVHAHFLDAHAALPLIREWEPLSNALRGRSPPHWLAVGFFVCAGVAMIWRRPRVVEALMWIVFTAIAIRYLRFATEATLVSAALLTKRMPPPVIWFRSVAVLGLAIFCGLAFTGRAIGFGLDASRFPIDAVTWLRAHDPRGPMLNSYNFGGYLLWARPEEKVFVDGRAFTVYDESIVAALPAIYADPTRFIPLAERYGFRLAVLQREGKGAGFVAWLARQPRWKIAYEDRVAIVLTRYEEGSP